MTKGKSPKQKAIETLKRRAGQYRRWSGCGWSSKADILTGAAERLERKK